MSVGFVVKPLIDARDRAISRRVRAVGGDLDVQVVDVHGCRRRARIRSPPRPADTRASGFVPEVFLAIVADQPWHTRLCRPMSASDRPPSHLPRNPLALPWSTIRAWVSGSRMNPHRHGSKRGSRRAEGPTTTDREWHRPFRASACRAPHRADWSRRSNGSQRVAGARAHPRPPAESPTRQLFGGGRDTPVAKGCPIDDAIAIGNTTRAPTGSGPCGQSAAVMDCDTSKCQIG